ncbi:hypothetical protein PRtIB026_A08070 [Pseudomonas sp. RtIB026]|nr:hypothetical protein PRtIB026_A08070 [Pseudomonas sp. RtIB026]
MRDPCRSGLAEASDRPERAAQRPRRYLLDAQIVGALRTPFAAQGRSYKGKRRFRAIAHKKALFRNGSGLRHK